MIALIDYKAGNLTSVKKALATIGADVMVPGVPEDLADAAGIIVPGVGHFGATRALDSRWREAILARVGEGRPLFGICLGMQWLFEGSDEAPDLPGLGLLAGRCYRLGTVGLEPDTTEGKETVRPTEYAKACSVGNPDTTHEQDRGARDSGSVRLLPDRIKIPHVGWNSLTIQRDASIVDRVAAGSQVYFTHSYVAPVTGDTVAVTEHGETFAAIVQRGHIGGVQFHPEKSGGVGLQVLRNFAELAG